MEGFEAGKASKQEFVGLKKSHYLFLLKIWLGNKSLVINICVISWPVWFYDHRGHQQEHSMIVMIKHHEIHKSYHIIWKWLQFVKWSENNHNLSNDLKIIIIFSWSGILLLHITLSQLHLGQVIIISQSSLLLFLNYHYYYFSIKVIIIYQLSCVIISLSLS